MITQPIRKQYLSRNFRGKPICPAFITNYLAPHVEFYHIFAKKYTPFCTQNLEASSKRLRIGNYTSVMIKLKKKLTSFCTILHNQFLATAFSGKTLTH